MVKQITALLKEAQDPSSLTHATLLAELSSTNPCTCRSAVCGLAAVLYEDTEQQKAAHANALRISHENVRGIANELTVDDLSKALDVSSAVVNALCDALQSTSAYSLHTYLVY